MTRDDVKNLLRYKNTHPKDDQKTSYNRWVSTMTHKLSNSDIQEALFLFSQPVSNRLYQLIKEEKI